MNILNRKKAVLKNFKNWQKSSHRVKPSTSPNIKSEWKTEKEKSYDSQSANGTIHVVLSARETIQTNKWSSVNVSGMSSSKILLLLFVQHACCSLWKMSLWQVYWWASWSSLMNIISGTGNGLAKSLLDAVGEMNSIQNATFAIVRGDISFYLIPMSWNFIASEGCINDLHSSMLQAIKDHWMLPPYCKAKQDFLAS